MTAIRPVIIELSGFAILVVNLMLLNVRIFARNQGMKVRWWSRSYAPERKFLRSLAASADPAMARRARRYLLLERMAWVVFLPIVAIFFWALITDR